jgi:hypothetical protein
MRSVNRLFFYNFYFFERFISPKVWLFLWTVFRFLASNKRSPTDFRSERIPASITEAMFEDQRGQHRASLLDTKQNVDEQVIIIYKFCHNILINKSGKIHKTIRLSHGWDTMSLLPLGRLDTLRSEDCEQYWKDLDLKTQGLRCFFLDFSDFDEKVCFCSFAGGQRTNKRGRIEETIGTGGEEYNSEAITVKKGYRFSRLGTGCH